MDGMRKRLAELLDDATLISATGSPAVPAVCWRCGEEALPASAEPAGCVVPVVEHAAGAGRPATGGAGRFLLHSRPGLGEAGRGWGRGEGGRGDAQLAGGILVVHASSVLWQ